MRHRVGMADGAARVDERLEAEAMTAMHGLGKVQIVARLRGGNLAEIDMPAAVAADLVADFRLVDALDDIRRMPAGSAARQPSSARLVEQRGDHRPGDGNLMAI